MLLKFYKKGKRCSQWIRKHCICEAQKPTAAFGFKAHKNSHLLKLNNRRTWKISVPDVKHSAWTHLARLQGRQTLPEPPRASLALRREAREAAAVAAWPPSAWQQTATPGYWGALWTLTGTCSGKKKAAVVSVLCYPRKHLPCCPPPSSFRTVGTRLQQPPSLGPGQCLFSTGCRTPVTGLGQGAGTSDRISARLPLPTLDQWSSPHRSARCDGFLPVSLDWRTTLNTNSRPN